jgi:rhodanese-related sulfurtransferase
MSTATQLIMGPVEYFREKLEYEISPRGLRSILERAPNNVHLVDVRERGEFDAAHIPGAWNIPIGALVAAYSTLPKDKMMVVYSGDLSCDLATQACLELAQKGYRVQRLIGGIEEWRRNGFPAEATQGEAPSQAW